MREYVHQIICRITELLRYYSLRERQVKRVQLSARQAFYSGGFHMIKWHLAISMPTKKHLRTDEVRTETATIKVLKRPCSGIINQTSGVMFPRGLASFGLTGP